MVTLIPEEIIADISGALCMLNEIFTRSVMILERLCRQGDDQLRKLSWKPCPLPQSLITFQHSPICAEQRDFRYYCCAFAARTGGDGTLYDSSVTGEIPPKT